MYKKDARKDLSTWRELYGIEHREVYDHRMYNVYVDSVKYQQNLGNDTHPDITAILNLHATVMANPSCNRLTITADFHAAFQKLVETLEGYWPPEDEN